MAYGLDVSCVDEINIWFRYKNRTTPNRQPKLDVQKYVVNENMAKKKKKQKRKYNFIVAHAMARDPQATPKQIRKQRSDGSRTHSSASIQIIIIIFRANTKYH